MPLKLKLVSITYSVWLNDSRYGCVRLFWACVSVCVYRLCIKSCSIFPARIPFHWHFLCFIYFYLKMGNDIDSPNFCCSLFAFPFFSFLSSFLPRIFPKFFFLFCFVSTLLFVEHRHLCLTSTMATGNWWFQNAFRFSFCPSSQLNEWNAIFVIRPLLSMPFGEWYLSLSDFHRNHTWNELGHRDIYNHRAHPVNAKKCTI